MNRESPALLQNTKRFQKKILAILYMDVVVDEVACDGIEGLILERQLQCIVRFKSHITDLFSD